MKKRILATLVGALTLGALALTGCGNTSAGTETADAASAGNAISESVERTTIKVGANITPHSEILYQAKAILETEGIDLEVVEIEDSVTPNTGVTEGTLDANYFQHQPYLDDYNSQNGTDLVSIGAIHYEPFGIYSQKISSIDELEDGAQVAVPNNVTNEARALLLLQQEGVITLQEGVGIEATIADIVDNPKNITFIEVDPSQLVNTLPDVSIAVINGNYALEGGLSVGKDAIAVEANDGIAAQTYGNIVVTNESNKDNAALLRLVEVLQSEEIKDFINNTYDGAVVPLN